MQPNPYASPAEQSTDQGRAPLATPLVFVACLFAHFGTLICIWDHYYVYGEGQRYTRWRWYFSDMVLLPESVVLAIAGIVGFTMLARARSSRLIYLGRAICIAQLIAPVLMSLLDRRLHGVGVIKCTLWLACANAVTLHLTLRRFEQRRGLALWSLGMILILGAALVVQQFGPFTGPFAAPPKYYWYGEHFFMLGQAFLCLLLALRVREVHRTWRSVEESHDRGRVDA